MPRAALLSIHARVAGTEPNTWEDPSLEQLWGPRFSVFVVAERDTAPFSLGTLSDDARARGRAEEVAARLHAFLAGRRMTYGEVGRALGINPNSLRYAAPTGRVLIRWEGARSSLVWTVPAPEVDPQDARLELARRYLRVYGPTTPTSFAQWAGIGPRYGEAAFDALGGSLTPVRTPIGDAWILTKDEPRMRAEPGPSGPRGCCRVSTPTSSCTEPTASCWFPTRSGAARSGHRACGPGRSWWAATSSARGAARCAVVNVEPWRRLSRAARDAVVAEAESLPLEGFEGRIRVGWD